jgi:hypothetical protein
MATLIISDLGVIQSNNAAADIFGACFAKLSQENIMDVPRGDGKVLLTVMQHV